MVIKKRCEQVANDMDFILQSDKLYGGTHSK